MQSSNHHAMLEAVASIRAPRLLGRPVKPGDDSKF